jgi:putative transposase
MNRSRKPPSIRCRRARAQGATHFVTVNRADRSSRLLVDRVDALRETERTVRGPTRSVSTRWALIEADLSRALLRTDDVGDSRTHKGERGTWLRYFWEHLIRGEANLARHVEYAHYNPAAQGYVMIMMPSVAQMRRPARRRACLAALRLLGLHTDTVLAGPAP